MFGALFSNLAETEKNDAIEGIISHASPRQDFFLMLVLAVAMAAFGIILGSTIILVGSMLIAPLLYPLLSLALGVIVADDRLVGRSLYTLGKSLAFSLLAGLAIGFLFSAHDGSTLAIAAIRAPSLVYAIVAAIAGFAAAFATTKPYLNSTLPGVAISVSLVPPLAAAGIALASLDWADFSGSLSLFSVNVMGIVFSAMIVFALMRFAGKTKVAEQAVRAEDRIIEEEAEPA